MGLKFPKIKHIEELSGKGLKGQMGRHQLVVGRREFLEELGIVIPEAYQSIQSKTAVYVAAANELAGAITLNDSVREQSHSTLEHLKRMGIANFRMITGDNEAAAKAIANQVGIDDYTASALPADKIHAVEGLKERPVAFVGDGVNDAPVLAASDVGIALGARGSAAASESADIVIMVDDVERVAIATAIAKKTLSIAKQSILIGIFISIGLMFVFSTGKFKPIYGAAIQEVVDVIVIFNALRALGPLGKNED
jgi:P-type E1-E2 ATPase